MKKIIAILSAVLFLCSCQERAAGVFEDYFVCIMDENDSETSVIQSSSDNLTMTYYVKLVAPTLDSDLTVNFDVIPGDGLEEGVDYEVVRNARSVTIARGVVRMPVRITYLKHAVDPVKDNTVTIQLTGVSQKGINIGYPGPKALFSRHIVTKQ